MRVAAGGRYAGVQTEGCTCEDRWQERKQERVAGAGGRSEVLIFSWILLLQLRCYLGELGRSNMEGVLGSWVVSSA